MRPVGYRSDSGSNGISGALSMLQVNSTCLGRLESPEEQSAGGSAYMNPREYTGPLCRQAGINREGYSSGGGVHKDVLTRRVLLSLCSHVEFIHGPETHERKWLIRNPLCGGLQGRARPVQSFPRSRTCVVRLPAIPMGGASPPGYCQPSS